MGLTDKLTEKRKAKLIEYLEEHLPEAGDVAAILPMVQTANPMFRGSRFFGITVTPSQVVLTTYPRLSETPNGVHRAYSRDQVRVEKWKRGMINGKLELGTPDGTFEVEVPRIHREDGEAVVAALDGAPA